MSLVHYSDVYLRQAGEDVDGQEELDGAVLAPSEYIFQGPVLYEFTSFLLFMW